MRLCVYRERSLLALLEIKGNLSHPVRTLVTTLTVLIRTFLFQYLPLMTPGKKITFLKWCVFKKNSWHCLCQKYQTGSSGSLCHKNEMPSHYHVSCSPLILQHNSWAHWCICPILANSKQMRKWKWLFENNCKCKRPISTMTEFLNLCQDGTNASICPDIVVNNDMSVAWISYIYGVTTCHLILMV